MTTSKGIRKIIDDATSRGMGVEESDHKCVIRTGKDRRSVGIVICEDGTAYRADVPLELCLSIRTQREMRSVLGL